MPAVLTKSDEAVREAVLFQLDWEPSLDAATIGVSIDEGVVALTGYVESYAAKLTAEKAAKRVYGVKGVANDLQVKLLDERIDPDIAHDAVTALRNTVSVPSNTKVTVRNGFLVLEGTVDWMYQKMAAEKAVKYLKGVKGVTNDIRVQPRVSPTEVKTKIEQALRHSAEVDARRINVDTRGEKVTLSGNVRSFLEREEAGRAAWAAPGVNSVENLIVVTP